MNHEFWEKQFDAEFKLDHYGESKAVQNLVKSFIRRTVAVATHSALESQKRELRKEVENMKAEFIEDISDERRNQALDDILNLLK